MQKQSQTLTWMVLLFFSLNGCHSQNQSFEDVTAKLASSSVTSQPEVGDGLPFFEPQTLTPTWKSDDKIVRIPPFQLHDQSGQMVTEDIFQGKHTVVAFIFSSCLGFCPMIVSKLKRLDQIVQSRKDIQFVLFSVDPEHDTPQVLTEYAESHGIKDFKQWHFLTGTVSTIYELSRNTFASEIRKLDSPANLRKFAHTEHFYVIDQDKRLRAVMNGTRVDVLNKTWREVATQLPPPKARLKDGS